MVFLRCTRSESLTLQVNESEDTGRTQRTLRRFFLATKGREGETERRNDAMLDNSEQLLQRPYPESKERQ